jgi:hypothetical protein
MYHINRYVHILITTCTELNYLHKHFVASQCVKHSTRKHVIIFIAGFMVIFYQ